MEKEELTRIQEEVLSDKPFELMLPDYGRTLKFKNLEEFQKWAGEEKTLWENLFSWETIRLEGGGEALRESYNFFHNLQQNINVLQTNSVDYAKRDALSNINKAIHALLEGVFRPLSGVWGKTFYNLTEFDRPALSLGLLLMNRIPEKIQQKRTYDPVSILEAVKAMVGAGVSGLEGRGELDAVKARLEELVNDWQERAETHILNISDQKQKIVKVLNEAAAESTANSQASRDQINAHDDEMGLIRKNYNERMKLDAPAKYWKDKKDEHRNVAVLSFLFFAVMVAAGLIFVWIDGAELVAMLPKSEAGTIGLGGLVLFTIPALAYFWFLRLISRIFVNNIHHMSDAGHRSTMVTTFLALIEDDQNPVSSDERLLVLQALFRPAGDGGDDGAPGALFERLLRHEQSSS